jgi:cyanophycinase-like exopeptidase
MTGPEHYREAERLLQQAHHYTYGDGADVATGTALAAEATGHATLAVAAATAMQAPVDGSEPGMNGDEYQQWYVMAGVKPTRSDATADERAEV